MRFPAYATPSGSPDATSVSPASANVSPCDDRHTSASVARV
jgi:hypothetical protein